jgi:hypothetical protein
MELRERGKEKENDRASVIFHTIRCKGREDIRMCIENCRKMGGER